MIARDEGPTIGEELMLSTGRSETINSLQNDLQVELRSDDAAYADTRAFAHSLVFGGQLVAQGLQSCLMTVPKDRSPVSLRASFLAGGVPGVGVLVQVERLRDGQLTSRRRCSVSQEGVDLALISVDFIDIADDFVVRSDNWPLPKMSDRGEFRSPFQTLWNFDVLEFRKSSDFQSGDGLHPFWVRSRELVSEEFSLGAQAFFSDLAAIAAALDPGEEDSTLPISFDQSIWFHAASNAHEWHYLEANRVSLRRRQHRRSELKKSVRSDRNACRFFGSNCPARVQSGSRIQRRSSMIDTSLSDEQEMFRASVEDFAKRGGRSCLAASRHDGNVPLRCGSSNG